MVRKGSSVRVRCWALETDRAGIFRAYVVLNEIAFVAAPKETEAQVSVTPILLVVAPLVVVLYALIFRINHAEHFAPQAYYRRKTAGAPVVYECESLGPRLRKGPAADSPAKTAAMPDGYEE